jgi:hypothetical protein
VTLHGHPGVTAVWERLTTQQPPIGVWWVLGAGAVIAAVIVERRARLVTRPVSTLVHEASHAIVATVTGGQVDAIRLNANTSGSCSNSQTVIGMLVVPMAGYLGTAGFGLLFAWLVSDRRAPVALAVMLLLCVYVAVKVRTWFGVPVVLVVGGLFYAALALFSPTYSAALAVAIAWFLLLAAVSDVINDHRQMVHAHKTGQPRDSDLAVLAHRTALPRIVWTTIFLTATLAAAVLSGYWMISGSRTA